MSHLTTRLPRSSARYAASSTSLCAASVAKENDRGADGEINAEIIESRDNGSALELVLEQNWS